MKPQVKVWYHGVRVLGKIAKRPHPVGLFQLGDVPESQMEVPSKDCSQSRNSYESNQGGPRIDLLPSTIWGGGRSTPTFVNFRPLH